MSKLFKTKATLQRYMSKHRKIYHNLRPDFVKIEMLLGISYVWIFPAHLFAFILLRIHSKRIWSCNTSWMDWISGLVWNNRYKRSLEGKNMQANVFLVLGIPKSRINKKYVVFLLRKKYSKLWAMKLGYKWYALSLLKQPEIVIRCKDYCIQCVPHIHFK